MLGTVQADKRAVLPGGLGHERPDGRGAAHAAAGAAARPRGAMCLLIAAVAGQNLDSCFHDPRSLQAIVPSFVRALQRPQVVMVRTAFF